MPGAASPSMAMQVNGEFVTDFNVAKGMLDSIEGSLDTTTSAGGMMSVTSHSQLRMKRL